MRKAAFAEANLKSHRALSLVAAAGLFAPASTAWAGIEHSVPVGFAGATLAAVALLLVCGIAAARTLTRLQMLDRLLLGTGIATLIALACAHVTDQPFHPADAEALIQGAAVALRGGHNPYAANLGWSLATYGVQAPTRLMSGALVDTAGVPSLPILLTLPLVALGVHSAAVTIVGVASLCLATCVMFALLPPRLRPLAVIVCVDIGILPLLASSGASAVMMLASISVCALRWRTVGEAGGRPGRGGVVRALCLGLAASTSQIAWFIAPFLLLGGYLAARERLGVVAARRIVWRYALIAGAVFLALNLPFVAWGPRAWSTSVTAPITQALVPSGHGLVGLATLGRLGGGALDFYGYGSLLLYLGLLGIFALRFERLARCLFLFPLAALYTSDNLLSSDWLVMVGVVVVGVLCDGAPSRPSVVGAGDAELTPRTPVPAGDRRWHPRGRRLWEGVIFLPALACFVIALTTPGPLVLELAASHDRRGGHAPAQLAVMVRNASDRPLTPRFAINLTGPMSVYWRIVRGPTQLRPATTARYVITPPSHGSGLGPGDTYILQAVTTAPGTISSSAAITLPARPDSDS